MTYTGLLYQDLANRKELTPNGHLPPILPITLYNGRASWSAATTLAELIEPVPKSLQRYQPQFEYFLLDISRSTTPDIIPNFVTALIDLEKSPDTETFKNALDQLIHWLDDNSEHRKLAKIFSVWLIRSLLPKRFPDAKLPKLKNLLEAKDMLSERVIEWSTQWQQKGRKEGKETALHSVVSNMLADGSSLDTICRITGLPLNEVKAIEQEIKTITKNNH